VNDDIVTAIKERQKARWVDSMIADAWLEAQRLTRASRTAQSFESYQDDPIGFTEKVLHEHLTDDQKRVMLSVRDNMVTIAKSATEVGKALPNFVNVLTPDGYKPIGSLRTGDYVIGKDGYQTEIVGVFPQGIQPTYRISFSDGSSVLCSRDHLWLAKSKSDKYRLKEWQFHTTDSLLGIIDRQMHIPICEPIYFYTKDYEIAPYIMGVLLGDGGLSHEVRFTSADEWIVSRVALLLPKGMTIGKYKSGIAFSIKGQVGLPNPFKAILENLGLMYHHSNDKFIPDIYMLGDIEQRKELLAGLLDTDGYITPKGSIVFTTVSRRLADQVVELVNTLGGVAKLRSKKCFYKKGNERIECQLAYNLYIKLPFNPFTLPKKSDRYRVGTIRKQPFRIIRDIEYVGEFDSTCIRVDATDGLFLTEHCIVTHNSFSAARLAIWFYRVFPDAQVYLTAAPPVENLKRILWGEIMSCVDKNAVLFLDDRLKVDYIMRNSQSFITRVTVPTTGTPEIREAKFSGKHAPHILFIVDEGDAVPDEVYKGIEGCLSGGLMPRLLVMFNPRIMQGAVYEKEINRQANIVDLSALNHPNVITGQSIIPGAVMRDSVVRRFNEWTRPLMPNEIVTDNCVKVPEFLENISAWGQDGTMFPPLEPGIRVVKEDGKAFFYMVLGRYPPQGESQLISQEWIDNARKRWDDYVARNGEIPPAEKRPIMGMDVAELGGDWNVVCLRYGGYVPRITESWQGMDIYQSSMRALDIYRKQNVDIAMIDGMGIGGSVAPTMMRTGRQKGLERGENWDIRTVSVKVSEKPNNFIKTELGEFKIMRDQLWWALREWLRTQEAMLPPDRMLLEELTAVSYDIPQDGKIRITDKEKIRDRLKRSSDRADALCLTFYPVRRAKTVVYRRGI
jgi:hypothetical protein